MRAAQSPATLLAATVLVVWGLITHGTYAGSGDEVHYLMIARSIAFDFDARLENDYADRGNLVGGGTAVAEAHVRPGRNGVPRPVHDIGLPLLMAPAMRVIYPAAEWLNATVPRRWLERARLNASLLLRHQVSLLMAVVAGFVAIEIRWMLLAAGLGRRQAFWWALVSTLSPPLLSFAFLFFTELPAALLVLLCLRRIVSPSGEPDSWLLTGVLVGLLTLVHVRNAPISLALAIAALVLHRRILSRLVPFALGIGMMAAVRTAITWHFWGTFVFTDHARLGALTPAFFEEAAVRATGLFFDREFGLLAVGPVYALAGAGLVQLARRAPLRLVGPLVAVAIVGAAAIVLPAINPYGFVGGWSPAPRFLVPVVPLLAVACAVAASGAAKLRMIVIVGLIALQILIAAIVWNAPKLLWEDGDGRSAIGAAVPALAWLYEALPTWHGPERSARPFAIAMLAWSIATAWLIGGRSTTVAAERGAGRAASRANRGGHWG